MSIAPFHTAGAATVQLMDAQAAQARNGVTSSGAANTGMTENQRKAHKAAEQFESVFLAQMLSPMFETVKTDSLTGGGPAEGVYRSMMVQQMGKAIAKQGGVGIADQVYREILKMQEA